MWIVFGNKQKSERVPNGKRVERHCSSCGETAMFYERTSSTKFSLYFIELLEYGKRRVMACGACGELYATDELGSPETQSVPEQVFSAAEKTGAQVSAAAKSAFGKLTEAAKDGLNRLEGNPAPPASRARDASLEDPLTSDEEDLEAKFRDLEKKYRVGP